MSQVALLYQLQQVDTEFQQKKERLTEVLRAQKETDALRADRQRAEAATQELTRWQTTQKDLNLELDGLNTKAKRSEQRLYSGNVKNPKELSDLQSEIQSLSRRRGALEDEILEAMIMLEEAEAEQEEANAALAETQAGWERAQSGLQQEQKELALRLHELTGQRKTLAGRVEPAALTGYEQLKQKRGGTAVAALKLNICQGCRLTVSANKVKEAEQGQQVYCGGCGRMLYAV